MSYGMKQTNDRPKQEKPERRLLQTTDGHTIRNFRSDLLTVESETVIELKQKLKLKSNLDSWLPSKRFHRVMVPTDLFALPTLPHSPPALEDLSAYEYRAAAADQIVIDQNINAAGRTPVMDYTPMVIIVWGQVAYMQALQNRTRFVSAWVGQDVFELMEIL